MCRFIETIRVKDGTASNLQLHQQRVDRTIRNFTGAKAQWEIGQLLTRMPADGCTYKARIVYDTTGPQEVEYTRYALRQITSLKLVECDDIDYSFKYEDRSLLNLLTQQRGSCDDIIIVKNGLLTESSYTNIALYDGEQWATPRQPLLKGTMRQLLLDSKAMTERDIRIGDLTKYSHITLFNAMIDFKTIIMETRNITGGTIR